MKPEERFEIKFLQVNVQILSWIGKWPLLKPINGKPCLVFLEDLLAVAAKHVFPQALLQYPFCSRPSVQRHGSALLVIYRSPHELWNDVRVAELSASPAKLAICRYLAHVLLSPANGLRDEPPSAGGGNCVFLQFTVPADRAQRRPKGVGSIEFDRRSASDAWQTQLAHLAAR